VIRPLLPDDVAVCRQVTLDALASIPVEMPPNTPENIARGQARIAHLQRTDPHSAWVAEEDGQVVGCALALVREGMWFLSLLMVDPRFQSRGLGRELLDATLTTATDRSWILATAAPAALRRYRHAGFDLIPCLTAKGEVDRALIPAVPGVREGSWAVNGTYADEVCRGIRGAGMTADLGYLEAMEFRLLVADGGYAILRPAGLVSLGAKDPATASALLWAVLAEAPAPVEIDWLAHDQQWAIDVCLQARLPLLQGEGHVFLRGQPPMSPYLPGGALG
jgi:GNAT superfamily N-acetyltransferase